MTLLMTREDLVKIFGQVFLNKLANCKTSARLTEGWVLI